MGSTTLALTRKIRGAILGAAVADALAFSYQHYSRGFLRTVSSVMATRFETHHSGFYPLGQYSDDTQLLLALLESVIESGSVDAQSIANHFVPLWRDNRLIERDDSYCAALEKLARGAADAGGCGAERGHAEVAPMAWCMGVGLWLHDEPSALLPAVETATRLTHNDPRTLACAAAAAAAVAHTIRNDQLILGPFLDVMASAAAVHCEPIVEAILDFPRLLSMTNYRAWREFAAVCPDDAYPPSNEGLSAYCVPSFLTAVQCFLESPNEYTGAVSRCMAAGGHIDTPAFLTGALVGALRGEQAVPAELVAALVNRDEIVDCADRLVDAWVTKHGEAGPDSGRAGSGGKGT